MPFRIDEAELVQALDRRILATLPGSAQTWSIIDHSDPLHSLELADLSRDAVLTALVESAKDALCHFGDDVSEDAREPYNGCVTIDGDFLCVRFGHVPRATPPTLATSPRSLSRSRSATSSLRSSQNSAAAIRPGCQIPPDPLGWR
jgi:hypothetical protein